MAQRISAFEASGLRYGSAHIGLLMDKYFYLGPATTDAEKLRMLQGVIGRKLQDPLYALAFDRWEQHWRSQEETTVMVRGKIDGRLAIGLGISNVLENGLSVHRTYGVPFIPASSLKGVLRRRLDSPGYERCVDYLFGKPDAAGVVRFQDALPVKNTPKLKLEVVTVHHQDYYGGKAPPTDFDSPVPIHFLAVEGEFLFIAKTPSREWRDYVSRLLRDVLEIDGVGGKRSSGYGRFDFSGRPPR